MPECSVIPRTEDSKNPHLLSLPAGSPHWPACKLGTRVSTWSHGKSRELLSPVCVGSTKVSERKTSLVLCVVGRCFLQDIWGLQMAGGRWLKDLVWDWTPDPPE